jgi:hypothetical protein
VRFHPLNLQAKLSLNQYRQVMKLSHTQSLLNTCIITCPDSHYSCIEYIEQGIQIHLGKSGTGISCKCGEVFHDRELVGKINVSTYNCYIRERGFQNK